MIAKATASVPDIAELSSHWRRLFRWTPHARDPSSWPRDLSREQLIKYARRYLRATGWKREPSWDFFDIWVRASKDGIWLNLYVVDEVTRRLPTVLREAVEMRSKMNAVIGVLTNWQLSDEIRREAEGQGTFVINPKDLEFAADAYRRASAYFNPGFPG